MMKKFNIDMTKDEFMELQEQEDAIMGAMLKEIPNSVKMGGKDAMIKHIAQTAVDLYEIGKDNNK